MSNPDEFWAAQKRKNQSSAPRFSVSTEPASSQEKWMVDWMEKWRDHFAYFDNRGCGCCVNIYEFDAPPEAIAEIPQGWLEDFDSLSQIKSGRPSDFKSWKHQIRALE